MYVGVKVVRTVYLDDPFDLRDVQASGRNISRKKDPCFLFFEGQKNVCSFGLGLLAMVLKKRQSKVQFFESFVDKSDLFNSGQKDDCFGFILFQK